MFTTKNAQKRPKRAKTAPISGHITAIERLRLAAKEISPRPSRAQKGEKRLNMRFLLKMPHFPLSGHFRILPIFTPSSLLNIFEKAPKTSKKGFAGYLRCRGSFRAIRRAQRQTTRESAISSEPEALSTIFNAKRAPTFTMRSLLNPSDFSTPNEATKRQTSEKRFFNAKKRKNEFFTTKKRFFQGKQRKNGIFWGTNEREQGGGEGRGRRRRWGWRCFADRGDIPPPLHRPPQGPRYPRRFE